MVPPEEQYGDHACWQVNGVWYPVTRTPVRDLLERENWTQRVLARGPIPLSDRFVSHRPESIRERLERFAADRAKRYRREGHQ